VKTCVAVAQLVWTELLVQRVWVCLLQVDWFVGWFARVGAPQAPEEQLPSSPMRVTFTQFIPAPPSPSGKYDNANGPAWRFGGWGLQVQYITKGRKQTALFLTPPMQNHPLPEDTGARFRCRPQSTQPSQFSAPSSTIRLVKPKIWGQVGAQKPAEKGKTSPAGKAGFEMERTAVGSARDSRLHGALRTARVSPGAERGRLSASPVQVSGFTLRSAAPCPCHGEKPRPAQPPATHAGVAQRPRVRRTPDPGARCHPSILAFPAASEFPLGPREAFAPYQAWWYPTPSIRGDESPTAIAEGARRWAERAPQPPGQQRRGQCLLGLLWAATGRSAPCSSPWRGGPSRPGLRGAACRRACSRGRAVAAGSGASGSAPACRQSLHADSTAWLRAGLCGLRCGAGFDFPCAGWEILSGKAGFWQ